MNRVIRNLIVFTAVALGGGYMGIWFDWFAGVPSSMQSPGVLLWLVSPLLAVVLLRGIGGDGWQDFGLGLHLKDAWAWYLAALFIPVVAMVLSLVPALLAGASFGAVDRQLLSSLLAGSLVSTGVKNIFEEFAWRGYLTPRFAALRLPVLAGYGLTGLIWACWHIPYYFFFLPREELAKQTALQPLALVFMAILVLPLHAFAYGEVRLASGSTWTAWLMHTSANLFSLGLTAGGVLVLGNGWLGALFSPGTEGVVHGIVMGLVGLALYQRRTIQVRQKTSPTLSRF